MNKNSNQTTKAFQMKLEDLIKEKGFKLKEIEKETGIPPATISKYQNDESAASIINLVKLANYFNVSTDWLLGIPNSVRTPSAEIKGISKHTGLSEPAINALNSICKTKSHSRYQRELIETISLLIAEETPPPNISEFVSRDAPEEEKEKADILCDAKCEEWKKKKYINILAAINDYLNIDLSKSNQLYIYKDGKMEVEKKDGMKNLYQQISSQRAINSSIIEDALLLEIQLLLKELKKKRRENNAKGDALNGND